MAIFASKISRKLLLILRLNNKDAVVAASKTIDASAGAQRPATRVNSLALRGAHLKVAFLDQYGDADNEIGRHNVKLNVSLSLSST